MLEDVAAEKREEGGLLPVAHRRARAGPSARSRSRVADRRVGGRVELVEAAPRVPQHPIGGRPARTGGRRGSGNPCRRPLGRPLRLPARLSICAGSTTGSKAAHVWMARLAAMPDTAMSRRAARALSSTTPRSTCRARGERVCRRAVEAAAKEAGSSPSGAVPASRARTRPRGPPRSGSG